MHGNEYKPTGTLNDAFLKWKDAIIETENVKEIVKLQSALHTTFCKTIVKEAKKNYCITDNDLVRLIDYFKTSVVIIKDYKTR